MSRLFFHQNYPYNYIMKLQSQKQWQQQKVKQGQKGQKQGQNILINQIKQSSQISTKNLKNRITPLDLLTKMRNNQFNHFDQYVQKQKQRSLSLISQISVKLKKNKKMSNRQSDQQANKSSQKISAQSKKLPNRDCVLHSIKQHRYKTQGQSNQQSSPLQHRHQTQRQQIQLSPQLKSELQIKLIQPKSNGIFCLASKNKLELQPLQPISKKQKHPIYQLNQKSFNKNITKSQQPLQIRYLSVQKCRPTKRSTRISHLSTDRQHLNQQKHPILQQLEHRNKNSILVSQDRQKQKSPPQLLQRIRQRIQKCKLAQLQQKQSFIISPIQNSNKIIEVVNHFKKIWNLFQAIQKKQSIAKLLECVRDYILEEDGDASELQDLYINSTVRKQIKKVIYYQRVSVILLVQLIIYKKIYTNSNYSYIRQIMHDVLDFYFSVQKDLQDNKVFASPSPVNQKDKNIYPEINKKQMSNFIKIYDSKYKNGRLQKSFIGLKSIRNLQKNRSNQAQTNAQQIDNNSLSQQPSNKILSNSIRRPKQVLNAISQKIILLFKHSKHLERFVQSQFLLFQKHNNNLLYYNLLEYFSYSLLGKDWSQWQIQFLETCPSPYIHYQPQKKYTLVLDLDETLIHYKMINQYKGEFLLRPYLFQFLQELSKHFQLGIFTCSLPQYADLILDHMKQIQFRLYRHHTIKLNNQFVKDLSRIGRDLKRVILVDNIDHNFILQKMNGIHIKSWYGDKTDDMLMKLSKQLLKIVEKNPDDLSVSNHRRVFL